MDGLGSKWTVQKTESGRSWVGSTWYDFSILESGDETSFFFLLSNSDDFCLILSKKIFKNHKFSSKITFSTKKGWFHIEQRRATLRNLDFRKIQLFLHLVQKTVCPRNSKKKRHGDLKKNSSEKIFEKKFFHEKRNFLDSDVIFLGNYNPKTRLELSFFVNHEPLTYFPVNYVNSGQISKS